MAFDDYPESGTIAEVKEWVGDDEERARFAYDQEAESDSPRVTLISWLEEFGGDEEEESVRVTGHDLTVSVEGDEGEKDEYPSEAVPDEPYEELTYVSPLVSEDYDGVEYEDPVVQEPTVERRSVEDDDEPGIEQFASGPDVVTTDDLTIAQLAKVVPGLVATNNAVDPNPVRSQIGNATVTLYTVDGTDSGVAANVRGTVQNFPVVSVADATAFKTAYLAGTALPVVTRIAKPALNTAYAFLVDAVTSPFDSGKVPTENSASKKLAQIPVIGDKQVALNDAYIDQSSGLYWVCSTAGDPVEAGTIKDIVQFKAFAPVRKENLDQWDAEHIHSNLYTQDYVKFNTDYVAATTPPADPSLYSAYSLVQKANAGRRAFGPGSVLNANLSVASPVSGTDDATWEAKFAATYVSGGVVHPSAVSYLRAAWYEDKDTRPETYDTGVTYQSLFQTLPVKGAVYDIKPNWPYEGGDGTLANATVSVGPQDAIGSVPQITSVAPVANGAVTIVATGTAFNTGSKLYVNDVAASSTVNTATTSTGTVTAQGAGSKRIRVDNSNVVTVVVP